MKINNPNWSKEYTLAEFAKLNPHIINENQLIQLYNQYLNKYLQEQHQQQIHFKQSKFTQLINEFQNCQIVECTNQVLSTMGVGGSYLNTPHPLSTFATFTGDTADDTAAGQSYIRTLGGPKNFINPTTYNENQGNIYDLNTGAYSGSNGGGFTARKDVEDNTPFGYSLFRSTGSLNQDKLDNQRNNNPYTIYDGATFSFWIKPHEFGVAGNPMTAWGRTNSSNATTFGVNGDDIYFDIGETIGSSSASPVLLATTSASVISAPHGMELNKWYHWTIKILNNSVTPNIGHESDSNPAKRVVQSIRPVKFYRDGVEVLSTFYKYGTNTGTSYTISLTDTFPMYIGGENKGNTGAAAKAWACSISEFAIFNVQKDIKDVYNASDPYRPIEFNKDTRGLIAYWKFDDGAGSLTLKDYGPLEFDSVVHPNVISPYEYQVTFNGGVSAVDGGY